MRRCARLVSIVVVLLVVVPAAASAQASITGVIRDTSGAVLPGVTVEAASPALIEKVRSVVSDGTGQYRIENLRPGAYTLTFTLAGFSTVKRESVQLTGTFTATVNAELRVGSLEETVTVTGETPVVDVQSTTRQQVFDQEILDALPSSRAPQRMAALIPGVTTARQDVGGILGDGTARGDVTVRGVNATRWTGASSYVPLFYNNARVTWQATQKHKFGLSLDPSRICDCPSWSPRWRSSRAWRIT